jgi:glutamine synthetase
MAAADVPSKDDVIKRIQESGAGKVKVAVADIDGVLRGKFLHIDKFLSAVDSGFGFCSVVLGWDTGDACYDNSKYTGWHNGYPDAKVQLDLATCRQIPWDENNWFVLGDFVDSADKPLAICPRQLLKKVMGDAKTLGYKGRIGCEFEWFNFDETPVTLAEKGFANLKPLTQGMYGYSLMRSGERREFFNDLIDMMADYSIPLEGLHTETGPGVYEAAICNTYALEAADRALLFKAGAKEIAHCHNVVATFMARCNGTLPGTSGHIHQSLETLQGKNVFYDETKPNKMSSIFSSYIAGLLVCLPEILPMFAPTVNSYKRLVEGYWAPTMANWGIDNRTCALRVIPGSLASTRVETRVPGADVNPYLGVAATLAAGLYGVRHKLSLDQPMVTGNGYQDRGGKRFPRNLYESTEKFANSAIAKELFGEVFVDHFAASRDWEWRQSQKAITDWELKRYFEII